MNIRHGDPAWHVGNELRKRSTVLIVNTYIIIYALQDNLPTTNLIYDNIEHRSGRA